MTETEMKAWIAGWKPDYIQKPYQGPRVCLPCGKTQAYPCHATKPNCPDHPDFKWTRREEMLEQAEIEKTKLAKIKKGS